MVVAPLHRLDPNDPPEFDRTLAQGRLMLSWTVFEGGARRARIDAATARVQGSEAGARGARMDAILDVLDVYLRVLGAREALVAQRTHEEELESERARAEQLVAEGAAARLELLRAEAELAAARAQGVSADATLSVAEGDLARLVGLAPERIAGAPLGDVQINQAGSDGDGATASDHPVLVQARGRIAAADAVAREAKAAWLPRLSGTGGLLEYGRGTREFTAEWQAGLQLEYPLFTGGARRARVAVLEADSRSEALASAVARFEELVRVEALALEEGVGVQAEFLRALSGLHAARVARADAGRAEVATRARLARVEGRLDLDWIDTRLEGER